jgi:hypothetical protein
MYNGLFSGKRRAKFAICLGAKRSNVAIFRQAVSVLVARTRQETFFQNPLYYLTCSQIVRHSSCRWLQTHQRFFFFFFPPPLDIEILAKFNPQK